MSKVQFSVLCNYPSIVSRDCITLGILFYNITESVCIFKKIQNWKRVASFNDELDIEIVKLQLESIEEEINDFAKEKDFDLKKYTKFYVNQLKFTEVFTADIEIDFHDFVEQCTRQYMPMDLAKDKRPREKEQRDFIKNVLKTSNKNYRNGNIVGNFNDNIRFDFIIKDYAFKYFMLKNKEEQDVLRSIKRWVYDAYQLKNKYKVIFVTDINLKSNNKYKNIYNMLSKEGEKVIDFQDILTFAQKI
nr:hypothetical protein [uncultured Intestinibacter sp.]